VHPATAARTLRAQSPAASRAAKYVSSPFHRFPSAGPSACPASSMAATWACISQSVASSGPRPVESFPATAG